MKHYSKSYHKGKYKSEWCKHLRPYLKRVCNKKWRKDALFFDQEVIHQVKKNKNKKVIKVRIVKSNGCHRQTSINKYKSLRDVQNAIKQAHLVSYSVLD